MAKNYTVMEQLKDNVTMTAATDYTEVELTLLEEIGKRNKKGDKIKCMMIHGIALEAISAGDLPNFDDIAVIADLDKWEIQFTTNSESAIVELTDKDLVWKYGEQVGFVTGGNLNIIPTVKYFWFPEPIPYIKKRLWVGVDATGVSFVQDINFTIFHSYGYVSQFTLNRMIAKKI